MKYFSTFLLLLGATASSSANKIYDHFQNYVANQPISDKIYKKFPAHFSLSYSHGSVIESNVTESSNAINDKLIAAIEAAREKFSEGFPNQGVPPLDPLLIDNFHLFIYQFAVISVDLNLDDIQIVGLKRFVINNINFKVVGLTLEFDFTLPEILFTSLYRIDGYAGGIIPFNPSGNASVDFRKIKIYGIASLGTNNGYLNVKAFKINFDVNKIKIYLSGLLGDGLINDILNWVLSRISESVIQAQKDKISAAVSEFGFEIVNYFLSQIKLSDLLG